MCLRRSTGGTPCIQPISAGLVFFNHRLVGFSRPNRQTRAVGYLFAAAVVAALRRLTVEPCGDF
jgi:hypothetical protein